MDEHIFELATNLGALLRSRGATITVAESCTGGGIASAITSTPGSSHWFNCSFVTYSNLSKETLLGVEPKLVERFGAVSRQVVEAMVRGALERANAKYSIATSGIAGPGGGSIDKPVGTVWIAWACAQELSSRQFHFSGDRESIRNMAVREALAEINKLISHEAVC